MEYRILRSCFWLSQNFWRALYISFCFYLYHRYREFLFSSIYQGILGFAFIYIIDINNFHFGQYILRYISFHFGQYILTYINFHFGQQVTFVASTHLALDCVEQKYLGQSKSSGPGTLFSYNRLIEIFFPYEMVEKTMLYFLMLFDCYSTASIVIEFR
jgi:hypothetical protein